MSGLHVIPRLIECGFLASIPIGLGWAATRSTSRSSAATRHFIWTCSMSVAVLMPLTPIVTPRWTVGAPAQLVQLASTARIEVTPSIVSSLAPAQRLEVNAAPTSQARRPNGLTLWTVATWIWMTGAGLVLCYVLLGHFAAWRLYRTTRTINDPWIQDAAQLTSDARLTTALSVVKSPAVSAPVLLHLWRPVIVMPEAASRWSSDRVRALLLHEFAHVKRNDFHVQSLVQLACALYWFNPLVWFAARQLRLERERACDDFVILCGTSRAEYATYLFEVAREASAPRAMGVAIGLALHRSQLEQRLAAIVNPTTPRHSTTIVAKFIVALPMTLLALAISALQIASTRIPVPVPPLKLSTPAIQIRAAASQLLIAGTTRNTHNAQTASTATRHSRPGIFHWAGMMGEHQTVEVYLGRGTIQVLPSRDDTVHVQARTDDPELSEIQTFSTSNGVVFCNVVRTARESNNYCERSEKTSRIQGDEPATEFVIYVPAGLHFAGNTILGDIIADHPRSDSQMATIDGNITLQLAPEGDANFRGNVINGAIDSDLSLIDNTPTLPSGERPALAPRIVHAVLGSGSPHLSAIVVNGNIRLIRRPAE